MTTKFTTGLINEPVEQARDESEKKIRVLLLEDNLSDAELMVAALRRAGLDAQCDRVATEAEFVARLNPDLDLILSDYALPQFNGLQALQIVRARGLDVPFILVSGSIGEDVAIEAMRNGADDYLLKDRMTRLGPAIRQALDQARLRREARRAESALRASEERLRVFVEHAPAGIAMLDNDMRYLAVSRRWLTDYRPSSQDIIGRCHYDMFPEIPERWKETHSRCLAGAVEKREEDAFPRADGRLDWVRWEIRPWRRDNGDIGGIMIFAELITERKLQQQKIERLSRIRALSSGINAAIVRFTSWQSLFDETCRIAIEHGGFGIAWIGTLDAKTLDITPTSSAGLYADDFVSLVHSSAREDHPHGQGIVGKAARRREAVFSNDISMETGPIGPRRGEAIRLGFRSRIALPLLVGKDVVGVIALYATDKDFFNEEELKQLEELAGNISFALESIAHRERIDRLSRIRNVTREINEAIIHAHDSQLLFEEACRIAVEQGNFGNAWIGLLDSQTLDVNPVACVGSEASEFLDGYKASAREDDVTGQGIVGRAIRARKPVFSNDGVREPGRRHAAIRLGYHSRIALPLLAADKVVGIMVLFVQEADFFTEEEIALLNELVGNISFALDHIRKSEALAESEERVRQLTENIEEVCWLTDVATHATLYISPAYEKVWGRTCDSLYASPQTWTDAIHADDRDRVRIAALQKQHIGTYEEEYRIVRPDGATRWVRDRAFPIRDSSNEVYRIAGVATDITERKQAAMALLTLNEELENKVGERTVDLERARREAEEASQAKSTFLAAMSHEIRTPMNGVIGMIDVLHQTSLRGDQLEMVDLIRESAFSLLGIINDILDFSKIEAGKLELEHEPTSVADVVEGVYGLLIGMAEKKGVALTFFTDPAIPALVMGDTLRLRQVLINLLNNAIKFSGGLSRKGQVSIRASLVEQSPERLKVEFLVTDNGIGMDKETQARLFTAFTQADVTTTRRFGGTGLGLAIAKHLVQLMSGEIVAQSAPGEGSQFKVRLPFVPLEAKKGAVIAATSRQRVLETEAVKPSSVRSTLVAPSREGAIRQGRLILIAEDNETNQKVIVRQLSLLGYASDVSADGREALARWRSGEYALLFTDLHMPNMDGYELTQAIRAEEKGGKRIPIIALTANALKGEADRCQAIGMDDYRSKPSPLTELKAVLDKWLPLASAGE